MRFNEDGRWIVGQNENVELARTKVAVDRRNVVQLFDQPTLKSYETIESSMESAANCKTN
ncbi:MAG TPA: hypothetical protein VIH54_01885 [Chthoniobacterales bacterium]